MARGAPPWYCASFLTAKATADVLRSSLSPEPVTFVITGDGGTAAEDVACADYITVLLDAPDTEPDRFLDQAASSKTAAALGNAVQVGYPGVHADDVGICLDADRFSFAMVAQDEGVAITLRSTASAAESDHGVTIGV